MTSTIDLATLKQSAHRLKPLLETEGVEKTHKQCLDFAARIHGFENFEAANALLPEKTLNARGVYAEIAAQTNGLDQEDNDRRARVKALAKLLTTGSTQQPAELVSDLASLIVTILAKAYPSDGTKKSRDLVRLNYPSATDELISERSMSEEGVSWAVAVAQLVLTVSIDYHPDATWKKLMDQDEPLIEGISPKISAFVDDAMKTAKADGFSAFGTAATIVLVTTMKAINMGVTPIQISRTLKDAIAMAYKGYRTPESIHAAEEAAMQHLMQALGISKKEAKRYLQVVKEREARGESF